MSRKVIVVGGGDAGFFAAFKEEFVTCGGISLNEVDAWTTGYLAAVSAGSAAG